MKQVTKNIYFSRDDLKVLDAVRALARKEKRSVSKMIVILLAEALRGRGIEVE